MRGRFAFKYVDITIRGYLSKVIISATIAEAQFKKWSRKLFYAGDCSIQAKSLGLKPSNCTIQSTHVSSCLRCIKKQSLTEGFDLTFTAERRGVINYESKIGRGERI